MIVEWNCLLNRGLFPKLSWKIKNGNYSKSLTVPTPINKPCRDQVLQKSNIDRWTPHHQDARHKLRLRTELLRKERMRSSLPRTCGGTGAWGERWEDLLDLRFSSSLIFAECLYFGPLIGSGHIYTIPLTHFMRLSWGCPCEVLCTVVSTVTTQCI